MKYLYFVLIAISCIACQTEPSKVIEAPDNQNFDNMLEEYYKQRLALYPLEATTAGLSEYNDILPNNISTAYRQKLNSFYQTYLGKVKKMDRSTLSDKQQLSYDVLQWECEINSASLSFDSHLRPINQMWSQNLVIGQMASGAGSQPFVTANDYRNWLDRLKGYERWCLTAIENMRAGMKTGNVLPSSLVKKVIPQMEGMSKGSVESHLFYKPVLEMSSDIADSDRSQIEQSYQAMVGETIIPLYQQLTKFLKEEYLPAARSSSGIDAVPGGKEYYAHQIKKYTTTNMNADQIFELGKKEVARLLSEMEKVKKEVNFSGDIKAFFDHVRNRKELMPFTKPEEVIANFNAIHEKMKPNLERLFDMVPKTKFEVRRTEAFREASASAEYHQGTLDGTRPGVFYVPIPDVTKYNIFTDEDLFLHEAIPGHHYQISLQQEDQSLPEFRRTLWYSAYGEGWALYCESLGKELGLYDDPYQYFGMLSAEMHRAIRLVVDAGMHAKGWTREQAIQYSLDNEAEPESSIISEIERYMANPGQALSYKVGQLKIRELRERAEEKLGDKFSIKTFHNIVLEVGCVPLELLERRIDSWIASQSK